MTYTGYVRNGTVVLDPPVELPEGTKVEVVAAQPAGTREPPLHNGLMEFAGKFTGLPEDASQNLDYHLYGHAKR